MANPRAVRCEKFARLGLAIGIVFAVGYPFFPVSLRWFTFGVLAGFYLTLLGSYSDLFWQMSKERKKALNNNKYLKALSNNIYWSGSLLGFALWIIYRYFIPANLFPPSLGWFTIGALAVLFLCFAAIVSNLFWEKPTE